MQRFPRGSPPSPPHSNELEHRLTKVEMLGLTIDTHGKRITVLERTSLAVIYAIGLLAAGKSGDVSDLILAILKAKP